jgi:Lipoxygenase.
MVGSFAAYLDQRHGKISVSVQCVFRQARFLFHRPGELLATLSPGDFTDPAINNEEWNLYPNVQVAQKTWAMVAAYVNAVVDAGYANDAAVTADKDLANWIGSASTIGNVAGLPKMNSKAALKAVVTSVLYRITYHGVGRLRNVGAPVPPFAPNYPPCLQSTTIPDPSTPLPTADLLKYLPNIGTLGSLITFYYIFAFNAPNVPLVPYKGPEDELFFDQSKYPAANQALIDFRKAIAGFISYFQPDWVQTGQWPGILSFSIL